MEGHGGLDLFVTEYWEIKGSQIHASELYEALNRMAKSRAKFAEQFGDAHMGPIVLTHDGEMVRVQYTRPFRPGDE